VSPVFRHGRLRLYLLKLLDEAPRHGYEVIRLLQDRFLGVYSPSPGTIYPRLTRLEDEGLVTHDEVDGKKIYRITDKGRLELRGRIDELSELEDELTASARGIAAEIGRDVRDTVRSLREELGRAASRAAPNGLRADDGAPRAGGAPNPAGGAAWSAGTSSFPAGAAHFGADAASSPVGPGQARPGDAGPSRFTEAGQNARSAWGHGPWAGAASWPDLERLAADFAKEILSAAARARSGLDERRIREVRGILTEALTRIRTEVFGPAAQAGQHGQSGPPGQAGPASQVEAPAGEPSGDSASPTA
jgi:DNA-binding PadR family transcriptional regulator